MINVQLVKKNTRRKDGKHLYTALYGNMPIVDVLSKSQKEAEEKFLFTLVRGLRGRTIDFNLENL